MQTMANIGEVFDNYVVYEQRDAEEFLGSVLNEMHEVVRRKRKVSARSSDDEFESLDQEEHGAVRWVMDESDHGTLPIHDKAIF